MKAILRISTIIMTIFLAAASLNGPVRAASPQTPGDPVTLKSPADGTVLTVKKGKSVNLAWYAVSGASGYNVHVRKDGGEWSVFPVKGKTPRYLLKNLTAHSTYEWQVCVQYTGSAEECSGTWSLRTPYPPDLPTGLQPTNKSVVDYPANLNASWTNPNTAHLVAYSEFKLCKGKACTVTQVTPDTPDAAQTTYHIPDLEYNQTYTWSVRSCNDAPAAQCSKWTKALRFMTKPSAPTVNRPTNVDTGKPTFSWDGDANTQSYQLQIATAGTNLADLVVNRTVKGETFTTRLPQGDYEWQVCGLARWGKKVFGEWNNGGSFTIPYTTAYPAPAMGIINNPNGAASYSVGWNRVSGASSYELQEATASDFSNAYTRYQGSSTSIQISGQAGGVYYYRVKAKGKLGESNWSEPQSTSVGSIPSIPNMYAISNSDQNASYYVKWSEVADATYYLLEENTSLMGGTWKTFPSTHATKYPFYCSGASITPGYRYYRVRAANSFGKSGYSNIVSTYVAKCE